MLKGLQVKEEAKLISRALQIEKKVDIKSKKHNKDLQKNQPSS
jgi:hypothetical protein